MYTIDHIIQLLQAYLKGEILPDEHAELSKLFEKYPELQDLAKKLEDPANLREELQAYEEFSTSDPAQEQRILSNIIDKIEAQVDQPPKHRWRQYGWYAAAACFIAVVGLGIWQINKRDGIDTSDPATPVDAVKLAENLLPGGNRATLQLADGTGIGLDQQQMGIVMGDEITYTDGSVALATAKDEKRMIILSTPRGGQYQIALADGTKVWLNADTRLRYPNKFTDEQRVVELDGEAYFEVAKVAGRPFIVVTAKEKVEVLGTHFNVYSFPKEKESKVSLLEGKVKVSVPAGKTRLLQPGEQASVQGEELSVQQVLVDESIAWKNDEFMFNNEPLGTALAQVARWYDIDIEIDPSVAKMKLWGSVSRLDNFDKVLKIIKMTDDKIKVQIEGRRVRLMK
ncbi:FecR domain-containing protein [Sphingobacterium zeae]|uniref:Transmembrane sensor n=1 Tax=Sphingobacterium zeae TaxID=1776859 RepID=A0ABU0U418_9SPHI|nr:FecR domain-containing protein [Sphingobacterium zeae]MDQ1148948.1 transmembrane sensor [Sphingobacterium zeae]